MLKICGQRRSPTYAKEQLDMGDAIMMNFNPATLIS
jgi:hypothetical protein